MISPGITYRPLGSVLSDHLGTHLTTVDAQWGGKCSSNMVRYQYLLIPVSEKTRAKC